MQATTLKNRLAKNYTASKATKAYHMVTDLINKTNKTYALPYGWEKVEEAKTKGLLIRPCYTSGSGRFASNQDHTLAITKLLDLLGVKYETGNDAPRGGLTGNYIKILTKIEY